MQRDYRDYRDVRTFRRLMMKLFILMLLLGSSFSSQVFSAEVGENMKAECVKIISLERSADVDAEASGESNSSEDSSANGQ
jgi:hypothetical protein